MKFAVNRTIATSQDRVLIIEREELYHSHHTETSQVKYYCCALIEVTRDWPALALYPIVKDTDSIQIRPKAIYRNSTGYYYKNKINQYLTPTEIDSMEKFIAEFSYVVNN